MIYGIEAAAAETILQSSPAGAQTFTYVKGAVTFATGDTYLGFPVGTLLTLASLTCTDNQYWGFAGWFKNDWSSYPVAFVVDTNDAYSFYLVGNNPTTDVRFNAGAYGSSGFGQGFAASGSTTWHHIIGAVDTNHAAGAKVKAIYVDRTLQTGNVSDTAAAFMNAANGKPVQVGTDLNPPGPMYSDVYLGSMCDFSVWAGIDLMQGGTSISSAVLDMFIDGTGHSVDPTTPGGVIDTFGKPPIFLTGGAASFHLNELGTSGAFTVAAGGLLDDADLPP